MIENLFLRQDAFHTIFLNQRPILKNRMVVEITLTNNID